MAGTIAKITEGSNKTVEVLSLEKSTNESVRNCPPEILARIASFLGRNECERIGEFFPDMEKAFEIAKDMNWLYLRGADFEQEELIDRGFAEEDNFLKHSLRISSLMSQDKEKTNIVPENHVPENHVPEIRDLPDVLQRIPNFMRFRGHSIHIPLKWEQCPVLKYDILFLEKLRRVEFKTEMNLPRAKDLHLYFKMFFGSSRSAFRQTRTPEITITTADGNITNGFVKGEDMKQKGIWRWVPVYSDKSFTDQMKVTSASDQTCTIRWFSENSNEYSDINWGGLTFVRE